MTEDVHREEGVGRFLGRDFAKKANSETGILKMPFKTSF
jgi:hypothetical protein